MAGKCGGYPNKHVAYEYNGKKKSGSSRKKTKKPVKKRSY